MGDEGVKGGWADEYGVERGGQEYYEVGLVWVWVVFLGHSVGVLGNQGVLVTML